MRNILVLGLLLCSHNIVLAQDVLLPEDLRQHNLTQYNSSLFNPTFSFDRNNPNSLAVWSRWQWQSIDGNPTTLFFNYSGQITPESSFGIGFLQNNTGVFLNRGALLNYAHSFLLGGETRLLVGANVSGFQQELADDRFVDDNDLDLPQLETSNSFVLQMTPGVRLQSGGFSLGVALENVLDLTLDDSDREASDAIFNGIMGYDLPVQLFDAAGDSYLRPMLYVRTVPNADTQVGLNALLSSSIFWVQGGYNSFYGFSAGAGATLFEKFSVGALLEFATDEALSDEQSTIELIASYHFGKGKRREVVEDVDEAPVEEITIEPIEEPVAEEKEAEQKAEAERRQKEQEATLAQEQRRKQEQKQDSIRAAEQLKTQRDSLARAKKAAEVLKRKQDSITRARQVAEKLKREKDSIERALQREQQLLAEQRKKDSIAKAAKEEVEVRPGEKYEEVATADGLEPGFYLIANVFGTKKYFEAFMKDLKAKGLEPKSFLRELNGYNYVYLERFDTIEEARKARDSKYYGKYPDKTWIFRVKE